MKKSKQEWKPVEIERMWEGGSRHERVQARFSQTTWSISDLRQAVKEEPVFDLPMCCIDLGKYDFGVAGGLIGFAKHMKHVLEADLSYPIIMDQWGGIIDGRHRLVKALLDGEVAIKCVRIPDGISATMSD